VLHALESRGVFASEGAACSTRKREQSRVLKSLGIPATTGSIRFSLSRFTTDEEIEYAAQAFADSVKEIANVLKATR
jgi:cysteine desulfurase